MTETKAASVLAEPAGQERGSKGKRERDRVGEQKEMGAWEDEQEMKNRRTERWRTPERIKIPRGGINNILYHSHVFSVC